MRIVLPLLALALTTAAAPAPEPDARLPLRELQAPSPGETVCRDRIHEVREERGLPRLDTRNADPEEPLLIAAVDKRIDGCSVLVMRNDTSDIRPIPAVPGGAPLLKRISGQ